MAAPWETFTEDTQWKEYLQNLVSHNDKALMRAIVLIYEQQTLEEKQLGESKEENDAGFTKVDAKVLGDIAEKIKQGQQLTAGELAKSRNKMKKYWKQLMLISKKQQQEKQQLQDAQQMLEKKKQFEESVEVLRKCSEEGVACGYGICDECPVTQGLQMRFNTYNGGTNCEE